jgi:hypothetical protein
MDTNFKSHTASELTYYPDFQQLLEKIFPAKKGYLVQTNRIVGDSKNKPDFTVTFNGLILFHIEAKLPKTPIETIISRTSKDRIKDQIFRYRNEGVQLLITDFLNLWLIDSESPNTVEEHKISFKCTLLEESKNKLMPANNATTSLKHLISKTCEDYVKTVSNVKALIPPLSNIAKEIKQKALVLLKEVNLSPPQQKASEYLQLILKDFKKSIFKEETQDKQTLFADLFAQTIVYGAFSAWIKFCQKGNDAKKFQIHMVGDYLPYGSFLRDLFLNLKIRIPQEFQSIFNAMEIRFQKTEYMKIISNIETLISTFYSDFLKEYDPITAKDRGVVYTPHEIVEFIIDGIDFILKRWFEKDRGIISTTDETNIQMDKLKNIKKNSRDITHLKILDPAAGTMAFASGYLHIAKKRFHEIYPDNPNLAQAAFNDWVKKEFFPHMYAFEILMAPYVLGHIRTFLTLEELGLNLAPNDDFQLKSYLMNTLMTPQHTLDEYRFNNQDIGKEIIEAIRIRDSQDIFVIMGNPPYNLSSQNNCEWINLKIQDYRKGLKEKNQKILSDDYVKFLRFGQWKIEQVGTGILAMITNNQYLDGQMFSVMRESLRKSFDRIYVVNLHGNMRKKESGNPFDILVGVAIIFMVRIDNTPNKNASVHYMDIPQPTREEKFAILSNGFKEEKFILLNETPANYFIEMNTELLGQFTRFIPIDELFKKSPTSGIMAGKDHLVMDVDDRNLIENLELFYARKFDELETMGINCNSSKTWDRDSILHKTILKKVIEQITPISYRDFDYKYLAYDRDLVEGARKDYIAYISPSNPAITVTKSSRRKNFCTAFISERPIEKCYMSTVDTAYAFLLEFEGKSNINMPSLPFIATPDEVFYYIYGILWSESYRQRYNEYLVKQYPRIPFPKDPHLFKEMSVKGKELAEIHLLHLHPDSKFTIADHSPNEWTIKNFEYNATDQKIYFDAKKTAPFWIGGIDPEIWKFSIGEIPQLKQFLDSRKYSESRKWNSLQRPLNHKELIYFLKICTAIKHTLNILPQLNEIYLLIDPNH